ncbi:MAG TPA: trypsin-like peptidase domain-containing protein, partial [Acidimicrobiales bacterium]|nr:trypsin-like peptidase domain-containing protein [Acidimicrobiales bacterium]
MDENEETFEPATRLGEVASEQLGTPPAADFAATALGADAVGGSWAPTPPPVAPGAAGGGGSGPAWVGTPGQSWGGTPSPYWPAPPAPPMTRPSGKRRRTLMIMATALLVVIAMAAGFGVGHLVWQSRTATSQAPTGSPGSGSSGSSGFPFGSGTLPSGSGSSGSSGFPFGSGGLPFGSGSSGSSSSGSGSSASGGPSDVSAIASGVDPGLVDVNTTLGYQHAEAAGTGVVLTSTGEVLTNNHVIDGATSISVTDVGNGRVYTATVVGYDRSRDVAVIQLSGASGLKVASIGDSSSVRIGEAVVGIGNGGGQGGTPSAAGGSVIGLGKSITATEDDGGNPEQLSGLIEVNANIQPGDSGGPLVDTAGRVLGIDTAASTGFSFQTSGTQGYAIPINAALTIAKQIEAADASATVHIGPTALIGVEVTSSGSTSGLGGSSPSGALVAGVEAGS